MAFIANVVIGLFWLGAGFALLLSSETRAAFYCFVEEVFDFWKG